MSLAQRTITTLLVVVVAALIWAIYMLWGSTQALQEQVSVLETIRPGEPIEYLDARGFVPREKHDVELGGKGAELRVYRSSGAFGVKSRDFIVVIGEEGIILAAFTITSSLPYQKQLERLGVKGV